MVGVMTNDSGKQRALERADPDPARRAQTDLAFGPGSGLSQMFQAYYSDQYSPTKEVWGLPMAEPTAGSAAGWRDPNPGGADKGPGRCGSTSLARWSATSAQYDRRHRRRHRAGYHRSRSAQRISRRRPGLPVTAVAAAGVVTLTVAVQGRQRPTKICVSLKYYGALGGQQTAARFGYHAADRRCPGRWRWHAGLHAVGISG